MRGSLTALILALLLPSALSLAESPVKLGWVGPPSINPCEEKKYTLWINVTENLFVSIKVKVNITNDFEYSYNSTNLRDLKFSEKDNLLEANITRGLEKGNYSIEFRLKPKCGAREGRRVLYAEIVDYTRKKILDSSSLTVNITPVDVRISIKPDGVKSEVAGVHVDSERRGRDLILNISCGNCEIKINFKVPIPVSITRDSSNSTRLNVNISYDKVNVLNITTMPQNKRLFEGADFRGPLSINLSDLLDLVRRREGEVRIYANGTSRGVVVTYNWTFHLKVDDLSIDSSIPYLIMVKGYDKVEHPYLSVKGSGAYSKVQVGDSLLLILYEDFFVPSHKEVSVEIAYFRNVSDTEIVIAYGFGRRNVIGGVGTLLLALIAFLLALITVVVRRRKAEVKVAEEREEEEELLIDLG